MIGKPCERFKPSKDSEDGNAQHKPEKDFEAITGIFHEPREAPRMPYLHNPRKPNK